MTPLTFGPTDYKQINKNILLFTHFFFAPILLEKITYFFLKLKLRIESRS